MLFRDSENSGPVHYIHEHYRAKDCLIKRYQVSTDCCKDLPPGQWVGKADGDTIEDDHSDSDPENTGCEHFFHVDHNDEMALQCELGLYLDFKTKDGGFPYGCRGFEKFKPQNLPIKEVIEEVSKKGWLQMIYSEDIQMLSTIPEPKCKDRWWGGTCLYGRKKSDPQCNLMTLQIPEGSTPMHEIFEEYASDNAKWIADFIPAFEKMLANGYQSDDLVNGPDAYTDVHCSRPPPGWSNWKYECLMIGS